MTFSEIFKKSFIAGFEMADISMRTVLITLGLTCVFAGYIFCVYRLVTRKTFYRSSYNITIAMVAIIVSSIVLAIQSNIVVSLGMVGALSIVRFRTAIKDPIDLMFMFWSIAVGIVVAAGLPGIALIASGLITIGIIVLDNLPIAKAPLLLILNADNRIKRKDILDCLTRNKVSFNIKAQTQERERLDMIIEVRSKNEEMLLEELSSMEGINRCSLVSHDGEVTF